MTPEQMRAKFAGVDTAPMFPRAARRERPEPKPKPVKSVSRAECPDCGQRIGLVVLAVRDGHKRVLGYRRHHKRIGRQAVVCRRSNTEAAEPEGGSL